MKLHQQGNEIIATELRQMSEITNAEYVLISIKNELYPGRHLGCGFIRFADQNYFGANANDCDGWLPIPQYRPEATPIDPEGFRKGVKALFDYLQDRVANNYHANSDQMAELQKMNKVFEDWLSDALQEVSENDYHEWMDLHQAYAAGAEKYKRSHELYEKLRKLNPREFAELHERNLRGEGSFDDLVSRLP